MDSAGDTVPVAHAVLLGKDVSGLRQASEAVYTERFGRSLPDMQVEVVSWRLRASSAAMADEVRLEQTVAAGGQSRTKERKVYFAESGGERRIHGETGVLALSACTWRGSCQACNHRRSGVDRGGGAARADHGRCCRQSGDAFEQDSGVALT